MILQNFTEEEILKELKADFSTGAFFPKMNRLSETFRRKVLSLPYGYDYSTPYRITCPYKSKRGNKMYFVFEANKRSDADNPIVNIIYVWDGKYGKMAAMRAKIVKGTMSNGNNNFMVYSSHLFSRYRERFYGQEGTTDEMIIDFIVENADMATRKMAVDVMPYSNIRDNSIIGASNEGFLIGSTIGRDGDIWWRTYVSDEMLRENQTETVDEMRDFLRQYRYQKVA